MDGGHQFTTPEVLAPAQEAESSGKRRKAATTTPDSSRGASLPLKEDGVLVEWILEDAAA